MKISIGKFNPDARTVPVTFEHGGVTHTRDVNACLKEDGTIDNKATRARVEDVSRGVEAKIAAGVLAEQQPAAPAGE